MKRDAFTLSLDLGTELIIDNFAGGGGTSTGLEQAFGRPVDIAINHDPEALAMHAANHPHTTHLCESVWDVDPIKVTNNRPVGLVWLSPDCFPAGTLVLTDKGYRAIETIQVGDRVLTHKLRWRAVTECSSAIRPLIEIRGHGHPGLRVSPEHPFFTRAQYRTWNNERRSYDHALRVPEWTPASAVQKGLYWGAPCAFPESVAPDVAGRGIDMSDELLWLAGRYLGDGWTRLSDTRAEVVITCGMHEVERLRPLLNQWACASGRAGANELKWHERSTATAYQFATNHRGLVEWLRAHFGHRAEAKGIPAWALGLPVAAREALLEGYLSADGHKFDDFVEAHTVSKSLAFGVKALANSLGKTVAVYCRPNSSTIQGREVNARDLFKVRWRHAVHAEHTQTYLEDGIEWCPVRQQSTGPVSAEVFNIGVEEDESYVVEGIIVHNCKHFSKAKGGKPVEKRIRGLAWVTLRWAAKCKPRVIMLENVEEFKTWGPLLVEADGSAKPDPAKKGKTFESFIRQLRAHGYTVDYREMRGCDHNTPTIRKRFFLVARRDGIAIKWPEPTHGAPDSIGVRAGKLLPYRTAAECIDFSLPCPSIFERDRPLAPATLRRIAKGIMRYVVDAADPFIVGQGGPIYGGKPVSTNQPFGTLTTENHRAVVLPTIVPVTHQGGDRNESVNEPFRTITGAHRGEKALGVATLVQVGYGERKGQAPRALDIEKPLGTVVGAAAKHALVEAELAPFVMTNTTGHPGAGADMPVPTITAAGNQALVSALLTGVGGRAGQSRPRGVDEPTATATSKADAVLVTAVLVDAAHGEVSPGGVKRWGTGAHDVEAPLGTVTASGNKAVATAFLAKHYTGVVGSDLTDPIGTVTACDHHSLVTAFLTEHANASNQRVMPADEPLRTICAQVKGGHFSMVSAHITKFRTGATGSPMTEPVPTITAGPKENPAGAPHALGIVTAHIQRDMSASVGHAADAPLGTITAGGGGKSALITSNMIKLRGTSTAAGTDEPLGTVSAGGQHHAEVRAFLLSYYGTDQAPEIDGPLATVTSRDRFGLVTIHGQDYQIVDIGLRMLQPRELFRAQGFPDDYIIGDDPAQGLKLTKSAQVRMCGNSVCPPMAKALILANFAHEREIARVA